MKILEIYKIQAQSYGFFCSSLNKYRYVIIRWAIFSFYSFFFSSINLTFHHSISPSTNHQYIKVIFHLNPHLFIQLLTRSFIYSHIHSSIYLSFIHLFIYLSFIHLSAHPFIHPFTTH